MRIINAIFSIALVVASTSAASAQGAKPAEPNSWGKGAVENAHSGSPGDTPSGYAKTNERGFSGARHDPGEGASHPNPPSSVSPPVGN